MKPWSLDKAGSIKLNRFGFPIVPDFGGTAHAYCGSTLDAAIGDCLSWDERPRRDAMLRAYIIKSRIREAENMLIVQPYSPHLFRQGMLAGPRLLLDVLMKRKTTEEIKIAWKECEKDAQDKKGGGQDWLTMQELPCRKCTDDSNGEEVWKPVSAFTWSHDMQDIEKRILRKGQDLVCFRCARDKLKWNVYKVPDIYCDGCSKWLARAKFDEQNRKEWELCAAEVYCHSCMGTKPSREERELIYCTGACQ